MRIYINKFDILIMKYLITITTILFFFVTRSYGQENKVAPKTNTGKIDYCSNVINEVDAMQLRCDTIYIQPWDKDMVSFEFKGIYFDSNNRLRKYWRKYTVNDGSHEYIDFTAYYDKDGNLVYIIYESGSNCEDDDGYFYVYGGKIMDYAYNWDCGCCEEGVTEEEMNIVRPQIGDELERLCDGMMYLKSFIHADTLLKILKDEKYSGYDEYEE